MHTRRLLVALVFTSLAAPAALAQDRATSDAEAILDKMTGHWVMTGTIGKKPTTHDVDVDWALKREYIRIHEVSRDKDASGGIGYEAWIYLRVRSREGYVVVDDRQLRHVREVVVVREVDADAEEVATDQRRSAVQQPAERSLGDRRRHLVPAGKDLEAGVTQPAVDSLATALEGQDLVGSPMGEEDAWLRARRFGGGDDARREGEHVSEDVAVGETQNEGVRGAVGESADGEVSPVHDAALEGSREGALDAWLCASAGGTTRQMTANATKKRRVCIGRAPAEVVIRRSSASGPDTLTASFSAA